MVDTQNHIFKRAISGCFKGPTEGVPGAERAGVVDNATGSLFRGDFGEMAIIWQLTANCSSSQKWAVAYTNLIDFLR